MPHAPRSGLQLTLQRHDDAHEVLPHAPEPLHVSVHAPRPHWRSAHAPLPVHVRSHVPAGEQLTAPHAVGVPEPVAVQPTVQRESLHVMLPHAPSMPQVMSHDRAPLQSTMLHAPAVGQLIVQFHPTGQLTGPPPPLIVQLWLLNVHDAHWLGQISGASIRASAGSEPTTQ